MAQLELLTKDQVRALVENCFAKLAAETEAETPTFSDPAREIHEQHRMIDERLQELRLQIRSGDFEDSIERTARDLLRSHGFSDAPAPGLMRDLLEGLARAFAEQARIQEFRLSERLVPYHASDALFASPATPAGYPVIVRDKRRAAAPASVAHYPQTPPAARRPTPASIASQPRAR